MKKSPFEITAAALKIMGKKVSAKKDHGNIAITCVFIRRGDSHAIATDGHAIAVLDINHYGDFCRPEMLSELAFYADMQCLEYRNGYAMITAEKKERFVNQFPGMENVDCDELPYPDWKEVLPPAEALKHSSLTGAIFNPGLIGVLDQVAESFDVIPPGAETLADKFYGAEDVGIHIAMCSGLLVAVAPIKPNSENVEIVPSKSTIQSFFSATPPEQTSMDFAE